jgi:hypothetical protein
MGKKKFKVFNDHPCIMHIEAQDHLDCLYSIPELVKNNDGSLSVKTPWQDFERVCYEVINAVHKSGKFRAIDYNWFYEIHDAIHHDDRLIAKLETMAKVSELEKRRNILEKNFDENSNVEEKYETMMGELACKISQGQKQRRSRLSLLDQLDLALDDFREGDVRNPHARADGNKRRTTTVQLAHALRHEVDQYEGVGDNFRCLFEEVAFHRRTGKSRIRPILPERYHVLWLR